MEQYLNELQTQLRTVCAENIDEIVDYFAEIISDRLENGEELDSILQQLGEPSSIASNFANTDKTIDDNNNKHLVFDLLTDLEIVTKNYNINIQRNVDDNVVIDFDELSNVNLDVNNKNGRITIKQDDIGFDISRLLRIINNSNSSKLDLNIKVPKNYCEKIEIENVDGEIILNDLQLRKLEIDNVGGDITIERLTSKELEIDDVNGDMKIKDCNVGLFYVESVNGDIKIDNIDFRMIDIETVNGDLDILMNASKEDVSLDIEQLFKKYKYEGKTDKKLKFETVNGDITYRYV